MTIDAPVDVRPPAGLNAVLTLGRLALVVRPRRRPHLELTVTCPWCSKLHHHTWGLIDADTPHPRQPHCAGVRTGPLPEYDVFPAAGEANRTTLAKYAEALAEWAGRQADATV